jgi:microcystin-dependent protein
MSVDVALLPHIGDSISELMSSWIWEEVGDSVEDITQEIALSVDQWYSNMLIGTVQMFLVNALPTGWLQLDGSTYNKVDYPELYDVLPSTLVTPTQFTLPDMDEVFPMGEASASATGVGGGSNTHVLTLNEIPSHTHTYTPPAMTVTAETPTTPVPTAGIGTPTQTGSAGADAAHNNMPAYLRFLFAIFAGR